jgi:hypothetical protein
MAKRRQAPREGEVEVRMLVDTPHNGELHPCNTVATFDADTAAAMVGAGFADDSPAGVEVARESSENKAHQARLEAQRKRAAADGE